MKCIYNLLFRLPVALLLVHASAHAENNTGQAQTQISSDAIKHSLQAHIEFLADDMLKGRDTGSAEYEIAARYVASHFKQYGLKPAGEGGSWFQSVPFVKSSLDESNVKMALHAGNKTSEFESPQQFVALPGVITAEDSIRGGVVFAGYGIAAKDLGHDDYSGLDVSGKIVLILAGRPEFLTSEEGAHVSELRLKLRQAEERGAIGVVILHTPQAEAVNPYRNVVSFTARSFLNWKMKEGGVFDSNPGLKGLAYTTIETAEVLFSAAGLSLSDIFTEISKGHSPSGVDMNIELSLERRSTQETIRSSNVIAVLEGSDPILKNEYVVYSAHLDHLGVANDTTHTINNGALDNASGVAIMLETAKRFSAGVRPKRSILFVVVTAEEKGLLGSNYFAHNPTVPISAMVANINLDMPLILYPFADIVAFGAQHSTMQAMVKSAAVANKLKLIPDPVPEQALFTRSDHYSFVKQGIPSIFLAPGFTSKDPEINSLKLFQEFFQKHYHQPSDDSSLPIDYNAGVTFTKVNLDIGKEIANSKTRPQWNSGDYFGEAFGQRAIIK